MKKIIILLLLAFLISENADAQRGRRSSGLLTWFSVSAKAGFGNSLFFNKAIGNDDHITSNIFTPSYYFGGGLGLTFNDNFGIYFEALSSTAGQSYDKLELTGNTSYGKEITLKSLDYMILFRYTGEMGGYFEIGPRITNINSVDVTNEGASGITFPTTDKEPKDAYKSSFTSFVIGTGLAVYRSPDNRFFVNIGLRVNYGFGDIMQSDENGNGTYPVFDDVYNSAANSNLMQVNMDYNDYQETHPFMVQGILEIRYFFGYYGTASCGKPGLKFFK